LVILNVNHSVFVNCICRIAFLTNFSVLDRQTLANSLCIQTLSIDSSHEAVRCSLASDFHSGSHVSLRGLTIGLHKVIVHVLKNSTVALLWLVFVSISPQDMKTSSLARLD
jgi:hypothetical protein